MESQMDSSAKRRLWLLVQQLTDSLAPRDTKPKNLQKYNNFS